MEVNHGGDLSSPLGGCSKDRVWKAVLDIYSVLTQGNKNETQKPESVCTARVKTLMTQKSEICSTS